MTWILTRSAKSSRELQCSLRQQLFSGYQRTSVQHQVLARQSQVHRSPRSRVDGVGPATEKTSSHLPDILHHTQRISRFTNGEIQPRGWPFPSHTTSLRYSDSDYEVIHMPIWPTKLLPAITSARLVVVASPTAARDDRCALSTSESTNYNRNMAVQTVRFVCLFFFQS